MSSSCAVLLSFMSWGFRFVRMVWNVRRSLISVRPCASDSRESNGAPTVFLPGGTSHRQDASIVKRCSFGRSPPWKNRGASRSSPWCSSEPASSPSDMSMNASVLQRSSCRMRASQHQSSEAGRPPTEQDRAATRISVLSWLVRLSGAGAVDGTRLMPGMASRRGLNARLRRSLPIALSSMSLAPILHPFQRESMVGLRHGKQSYGS